MIILISGARFTGKTTLAKRLSERYQIPYKNTEHLKKNIVLDDDTLENTERGQQVFLEKLWFIAESRIQNCMMADESIVLDIDYLPPQKVRILNDEGVLSMHLLFSAEYIEKNYLELNTSGTNGGQLSKKHMLEENSVLKDTCADEVVSYFMFQENHEVEMDLVCELIECMRP